MYMLVHLPSCLFIYVIVFIFHVNSTCFPRTNTHNLSIQNNPPDIVHGRNKRYQSIDCCVDGFNILLWYFRRINQSIWELSTLGFIYLDNNRTLVFKEPYDFLNDGFYLCSAQGYNGQSYNHTTFVYFLDTNENRTITIIQPNQSSPKTYNVGDNFNISCQGKTYEPEKPVLINWSFRKDLDEKPIKRSYKIENVVVSAADRPYESNPDFVEISSYLIIKHLKKQDSGSYRCQMTQGLSEDRIDFTVIVIDDRINLIIIILLVISTIFIFIMCILAWKFHYNVIYLYKSYLDPCPRGQCRDIDVSIIYEEMDLISLQISEDLVIALEKQGFRCWSYDRDKTYGKDRMEDFAKVLSISHVVVIILSFQSAIEGVLLKNLISIIPDPAVCRLYVFNPSTKTILQLLKKLQSRIMKWMKKELRLQSIFRNNNINFDSRKFDKHHYSILLAYIMSFLPTATIRTARRKCAFKI